MSALVIPMQDERVTIASDLLGAITLPTIEIVRLPAGLYGFPECRTFALLPAAREGLFWLQSAEYSALSFLLVDPFVHFPDYHIDLDDVDITRMGTTDPQHILVLAIVTIGDKSAGSCTANLHAPVLFNIRDRHAHQSIRPDDGYGIREPFNIDQPPVRESVASGA